MKSLGCLVDKVVKPEMNSLLKKVQSGQGVLIANPLFYSIPPEQAVVPNMVAGQG